ncbi:MAG: tetratricopeptide repeat protein [Proteobacteria bacterium]|nr:tetratricopeptide repeat protein [Pseudomonadota bacterium]
MTDDNMPAELARALESHRAGDLEAAAAAYEAILGNDPGNIDALHLLATLNLQRGDAANALRLAERVLSKRPEIAEAQANRGTALQAMERFGEAAHAFRQAIELQPDTAHFYYNLGNALRADGDKPGAATAYRRAIAIQPGLAQAHSNLGATLSELGLFDQAAAHCQTAISVAPEFADAHYNLGNAHREAGRFEEARDAYGAALALRPAHADALCNLGLTMMTDQDREAAVDILSRATQADAGHDMARFYLGVALLESGDGARGADVLRELADDDPIVEGWLSSLDYLGNLNPAPAILHDPYALLALAMGAAEIEGLVLEFGVRHGASIRHLAKIAGQEVHGFDSFHGLPAAWGGEPKGVYSTAGELPDVPANVNLIPGLFEDTLTPFLDAHPGPVRFCNVDSDLYASASTVLDRLAPRIQPGSVLVFDEYLINPTWREDEFRAFQEASGRHRWRYRYLAASLVTKQAAVLIEKVG